MRFIHVHSLQKTYLRTVESLIKNKSVNLTGDFSVNLTVRLLKSVNLVVTLSGRHPACATKKLNFICLNFG